MQSKYGLQIRKPSAPAKPKLPAPASIFKDDCEEEDDVERKISSQAAKNRDLQRIEEDHKRALEEDPSVFDYDGVYDAMKDQTARPKAQDRQERKPKYIENLIKKTEERKREQDIVYERKVQKELNKENHMYADKEKFVTSAYRKKLEEQRKWVEEDKRRQILEEKEDVTKKKDLSDFYFGLQKNVAFGAASDDISKREKVEQEDDTKKGENDTISEDEPRSAISSEFIADVKPVKDEGTYEKTSVEGPSADQITEDHYKRSDDSLAQARERFLARKRAKLA